MSVAEIVERRFPHDVLSREEHQRVERMHRQADRELLLAAHVALRHLLGAYSGKPPGGLGFVTNAYGKPSLDTGSVAFNLSHSGDRMAVAISRSDVGVDVERIRREMVAEDLAREVFSQRELTWLDAHGDRQPAAFFRLWTLKEAFLKAEGRGLSLPCGDVVVEPRGVGAVSPVVWRGQSWAGQELPADPHYCLAVVSREPMRIEMFTIRDIDHTTRAARAARPGAHER